MGAYELSCLSIFFTPPTIPPVILRRPSEPQKSIDSTLKFTNPGFFKWNFKWKWKRNFLTVALFPRGCLHCQNSSRQAESCSNFPDAASVWSQPVLTQIQLPTLSLCGTQVLGDCRCAHCWVPLYNADCVAEVWRTFFSIQYTPGISAEYYWPYHLMWEKAFSVCCTLLCAVVEMKVFRFDSSFRFQFNPTLFFLQMRKLRYREFIYLLKIISPLNDTTGNRPWGCCSSIRKRVGILFA